MAAPRAAWARVRLSGLRGALGRRQSGPCASPAAARGDAAPAARPVARSVDGELPARRGARSAHGRPPPAHRGVFRDHQWRHDISCRVDSNVQFIAIDPGIKKKLQIASASLSQCDDVAHCLPGMTWRVRAARGACSAKAWARL
eukprot:scaffold190550_cov24-Tisochrysis_lutea.AAC.1